MPDAPMPDANAPADEIPAYHDLQPFRELGAFHAEAQGLQMGFYPAGADRLERLLGLINDAAVSLQLAFYIFDRDQTSQKIRDALAEAARRGVAVTVIVDGYGAEADGAFFAPMTEAGGVYHCFQAHWSRRYLIRNHQKMVIADSRIAMLGGFNIADAYFEPPEKDGWNDLGVTLEGDAVAQLEKWFRQLAAWAGGERPRFRGISRLVREWDGGTGCVQVLIGGPTKGLSSWARRVSQDLRRSAKLDMMMAYFAPPRHLRRRIRRIASSGEARLVLAGKSDNAATIGASRSLYSSLLKSGARIWEFQPCKLHTKLIVLDDTVYLGSANFDMRSLYLNLEIVLRIEDHALAERMRGFIAGHVAASQEITAQVHRQNAGWLNRLRWTACWFLVSVVDYTVSRKLNLGL